ncbi:MAG: hypothetical protein B6D45_00300, partial [Ignavibacteriales bacterium UTCHB3]
MPDRLKGEVEKITFYSEDSGFGVIRLRSGRTITGTLPKLNEGDRIEAEGEWMVHPKFGAQLKVSKITILEPKGKAAILKYLLSGVIKGFTKTTAKRFVDLYGEDALDILEKEPKKILKVPGISETQYDIILKSWSEQK